MEPRDKADTAQPGNSGPVLDLDQAFLRQTGEDARAFFPRHFADVELVLIDVDPNHIHAFWNLPPAVIENARSRSGRDARMVLRLYPADSGAGAAAEPIEVEVGGLQGRSYVGIWQPERRYRGMIGLRTGGDDVMVLATSNEVTLPPTGPAPDPAAEGVGRKSAGSGAGDRGDGGGDGAAPLFDLEAVLPVSSYVLSGERVAFEANAELHIHGRADPAATVRLFGQPVPLRPDGSFSVVRVLPQQSRLLSALLAAAAAEPDGTV